MPPTLAELTWLTRNEGVWVTPPNVHAHRFVIVERTDGVAAGTFTLEDRKFTGRRPWHGTVVRRQEGLVSLPAAQRLAQLWERERHDNPRHWPAAAAAVDAGIVGAGGDL